MCEQADRSDAPELPRWLKATLADIASVKFEKSTTDLANADCCQLNNFYQGATSPANPDDYTADTAKTRVFSMLAAITSMYLNPNEPNEPFCPMMMLPDGSRSPTIADFKAHANIVAALADRSKSPTLRARLADLAWILDRRRIEQGVAALAAYTRIVQEMTSSFLMSDDQDESGFTHKCRDNARRALQISDLLA